MRLIQPRRSTSVGVGLSSTDVRGVAPQRVRGADRRWMTTPARRPGVVTLTALDDIVAAVPHLLGFHPTESLVAVAMTGRRERLSFSMRVDLPPDAHTTDVVDICVRAMGRARAEQVLLFVYTDAAHPPADLPRRDLVEQVVVALPVAVRDALLVSGDRVWSYLCDVPDCCPPQGRRWRPDTPGALALAAAHALQGQSVLPSRDALVAWLAPPAETPELVRATAKATGAFLEAGESASRAGAVRLLADLRTRYAAPPAGVALDEAALLVVALHDLTFRDHAVQMCLESLDAARGLFGDLVRSALPPRDAPACTVLAVSAYL
jgi:hypothetical protein